MVSFSSRLAATALAALSAAGCWTGRLFEVGRLSESVATYHAVTLSGGSLRIDYTVERFGRLLLVPSRGRRTASVPLAALSARPAYPVDAFPIQQQVRDTTREHGVPLRMVVGECPRTRGGEPEETTAPLVVAIPTEAGRGLGLCICSRAGGPCAGYLPSEALYRDGTAWWVYPLIPVAVAIDIAVVPLQLVSASPFFLVGD
jgi:hypothetical protein